MNLYVSVIHPAETPGAAAGTPRFRLGAHLPGRAGSAAAAARLTAMV